MSTKPKRPRKLQELSEVLSQTELTVLENADITVLRELSDECSEISDPRDESYVKHKLSDIIMIVLLAVMAGLDDWKSIELFAKEKVKWLSEFLCLNNGVPTDDTYRLVISKININYLYSVILGFLMEKVNQIINLQAEDAINNEKEIISCDGKVSKSSKRNETDKPGQKALDTLSAYSSIWGVCLAQEFIEKKTNEITAMPTLLKKLDISGAIITCDALNTQTEIVAAVIEGKADYVMPIKRNKKTLFGDLKEYFDESKREEIINAQSDNQCPSIGLHYKQTIDLNDHCAKKTTREYFLSTDICWLYKADEWAGLKTIGMSHKTIEPKKAGAPITYEDHYYISSIDNIDDFARSCRQHWGVESMHWHLDYTFNDDHNTTTRGNGAEGLQIFKKVALSVLKCAQTIYPKYTSINNIRKTLCLSFEKEIQKVFSVLNVNAILSSLVKH